MGQFIRKQEVDSLNRMKITFVSVLLLILPSTANSGEPFRFAAFCDSRGDLLTDKCADGDSDVSSVLPVIVEDVLYRHRTTPIRLVVFPGDMISGALKRDQPSVADCNRLQLQQWRNTIKPILDAGIDMRVTAGNHEMITVSKAEFDVRCSPHNWPYTSSQDNVNILKEILGDMLSPAPGPTPDMGLTYSFDAGGCHFVFLAAYTMYENNSFSNETLKWLENDLKAASEKGFHIMVASHAPAFPGGGHMWDCIPFFDPEYACDYYSGIDRRKDRDRFWNILKEFNTVAYFCGHEHNIQVQEVEGVWQIVSAGITAKLYELNGSKKDRKRNTTLYDGRFQNPRASVKWPWDDRRKAYWGWCMVTVDGNNISLEVFGSDSLPTKRSDLKLLKSFSLRKNGQTR